MDACLAFYADLGHRKRRWKTSIKTQQSEERLFKRKGSRRRATRVRSSLPTALGDLLPEKRVRHAIEEIPRASASKFVPLNRDRNGATNIGTNFQRLFKDKAPIRSLSEDDLAFHRATLCLECSD